MSAPTNLASPLTPVRFRFLLGIYAVVPLCLAVILLDRFAFGSRLRASLPWQADDLPFFALLFGTPHIIASHLIFLDRGYLVAYRRRLLIGVVGLFALTAAAGMFLSWNGFGVFAYTITFYHIVGQQIGLTGAQLRTSDWAFPAWKWVSLVGSVCVLFATVAPGAPGHAPRGLPMVGVMLCVPTTLLAVRLHRRSATADGRRYLWATQGLLLAVLVAFVAGYPLLAGLMPRLVHDLTAFYVYGVHDHNRNREFAHNWLHHAAAVVQVPSWAAGAMMAVALQVVLLLLTPRDISMHIVYWLSGLHYYLEGHVWQRGTPHRESAPFV